MIEIIKFNYDNKVLSAISMKIRQKVFVEEENVDAALEFDGKDDEATHYLLYYDGQPIGTARWRPTPKGIKLERFALLPKFRNQRTGSKLLDKIMVNVLETGQPIYLHSQEKAVTYYERVGFKVIGEAFIEAGLKHYKMEYSPEQHP